MSSTTANALLKIEEFNKRSGGTDWLSIKEDLVIGLKSRLALPNNVDTSSVNLCGPGAFFRCLAMDEPVMYAQAVIDLYEKNKGFIGKREMKASHTLRITKPAEAAVDWVPMASLRDDENTLLSYTNGAGLDGLTMPSAMAKWFKQAGYSDIKNETNVFFTKDLANIKEADRLRGLGYRVCLFIDADMLNSAKQESTSTHPDHWVTLNNAIAVSEDNFSAKVHSWGKIMPIPSGGTMKVSTFLKHYYGYVAAKPG